MKTVLLSVIVLLASFDANAAFATLSSTIQETTILDKIKSGVVETLYYGDQDLSEPIKELIAAEGNADLLVATYKALDKNQINLKHTILIVLIKKQQKNSYDPDAQEHTKQVLVSALTDDHAWIRTEAVWGLRYYGDLSLMRRISPMVNDESEFVRKEAQATLIELYELYQDRTDNVF